jgi:hypothetical protein
MLIEDPPQHTPGAWKMKRYLVDRTQNIFWEWTAINDGHFPTASLVGPQVWPASGHPPSWVDLRDVTVITPRHGYNLRK